MTKREKFEVEGVKGFIHYVSNNFIVCCHGLYSNKESKKYVEMAERANNAGLSCVRFDFRGCGESKGKFSFSLRDKVDDLDEVIHYIAKKFGNPRFSLFGSSFGGMTSLFYGSENKVNSIVILSTPLRIGFEHVSENVTPYAEKCSHVLIMHGLKDELVPNEDATIIYETAKQPKKLLFFNTDHSFSEENERAQALEEAIKWFKTYF